MTRAVCQTVSGNNNNIFILVLFPDARKHGALKCFICTTAEVMVERSAT